MEDIRVGVVADTSQMQTQFAAATSAIRNQLAIVEAQFRAVSAEVNKMAKSVVEAEASAAGQILRGNQTQAASFTDLANQRRAGLSTLVDAQAKVQVQMQTLRAEMSAVNAAVRAGAVSTADLGTAGATAGAGMRVAGEGAQYFARNLTEARFTGQLLNTELGLGMPRAMSSILAASPVVGAAMRAALPVAVGIGMVEVFKNLVKEIINFADAWTGVKRAKEIIEETTAVIDRQRIAILQANEAHLRLNEVGTSGIQKLRIEYDNTGKAVSDWGNRHHNAMMEVEALRIKLNDLTDMQKQSAAAIKDAAKSPSGMIPVIGQIDQLAILTANYIKLGIAITDTEKAMKEKEATDQALQSGFKQRLEEQAKLAAEIPVEIRKENEKNAQAQISADEKVALGLISSRERTIHEMRAIGEIGQAAEEAALIDAADQKLKIERQSARDRIAILQEQAKTGINTLPEQIAIHAQIEAAEREHQDTLTSIFYNGLNQRIAALREEDQEGLANLRADHEVTAAEEARYWRERREIHRQGWDEIHALERKPPVPTEGGASGMTGYNEPISTLPGAGIATGGSSRDEIKARVAEIAAEVGVSVSLGLALAQQESGFRQQNEAGGTLTAYTTKEGKVVNTPEPGAVPGGRGVMGLTAGTAKDLGVDFSDAEQNIRGGLTLLARYLAVYGDEATALQAYFHGAASLNEGRSKAEQAYIDSVLAAKKHFDDIAASTTGLPKTTGAATPGGGLANIPAFAKGGLVEKPTIILAGDAGPEVVIPVDQLQNFILASALFSSPGKVVPKPDTNAPPTELLTSFGANFPRLNEAIASLVGTPAFTELAKKFPGGMFGLLQRNFGGGRAQEKGFSGASEEMSRTDPGLIAGFNIPESARVIAPGTWEELRIAEDEAKLESKYGPEATSSLGLHDAWLPGNHRGWWYQGRLYATDKAADHGDIAGEIMHSFKGDLFAKGGVRYEHAGGITDIEVYNTGPGPRAALDFINQYSDQMGGTIRLDITEASRGWAVQGAEVPLSEARRMLSATEVEVSPLPEGYAPTAPPRPRSLDRQYNKLYKSPWRWMAPYNGVDAWVPDGRLVTDSSGKFHFSPPGPPEPPPTDKVFKGFQESGWRWEHNSWIPPDQPSYNPEAVWGKAAATAGATGAEVAPTHISWVNHPNQGVILNPLGTEHTTWFGELGLPQKGNAFDRIERGMVEVDHKGKTVTMFDYSEDVSPTSLEAKLKTQYPSLSKYKFEDHSLNWLVNQVQQGGKLAPTSGVGAAFDKEFGSALPKLAEGGVVPGTPGGTTIKAGEGGAAEAILPLASIDLARSVLTAMGADVHFLATKASGMAVPPPPAPGALTPEVAAKQVVGTVGANVETKYTVAIDREVAIADQRAFREADRKAAEDARETLEEMKRVRHVGVTEEKEYWQAIVDANKAGVEATGKQTQLYKLAMREVSIAAQKEREELKKIAQLQLEEELTAKEAEIKTQEMRVTEGAPLGVTPLPLTPKAPAQPAGGGVGGFLISLGALQSEESRIQAELTAFHAQQFAAEMAFEKQMELLHANEPEVLAQIKLKEARIQEQANQVALQDQLKTIKLMEAQWQQFFNTFNQGFTHAIDQAITGKERFRVAMAQLYNQLILQQINFVIQWLLKEAERWLMAQIFHRAAQVVMTADNARKVAQETVTQAAITKAATAGDTARSFAAKAADTAVELSAAHMAGSVVLSEAPVIASNKAVAASFAAVAAAAQSIGDLQAASAVTVITANVAMAESNAGAAGSFEFLEMLVETGGDIPVAVAYGFTAYAAGEEFVPLAGFAQGGIVPNTGVALVHKGEEVVPGPTVQMVNQMAANGGSNRGGHTFHVTYAPTINGKMSKQDIDEHVNYLFNKMESHSRTFNRG